MRIHVVVDFTYILYKYKFTLLSGRLKTLTYGDRDVSLLYYCLKEVEGFRSKLEGVGHDVTMTVCFDSKSARAEQAEKNGEEYKGKRVNKLSSSDFELIEEIKDTREKDNFDYTIVYTPDKDVLINIDDRVGVMRYKQKKGYEQIEKDNFSAMMSNEFNCFIPYNVLALYLSSVGDKADNIKGISSFGPVAYSKLIGRLIADGYGENWEQYRDFDRMQHLIEACHKYLNDSQYKELMDSFNLVRPMVVDSRYLPSELSRSSRELREMAYGKYGFQSLYN